MVKKVIAVLILTLLLYIPIDGFAGTWYFSTHDKQHFRYNLEQESIARNRITHPYFDHAFVPYSSVPYAWGNNRYTLFVNSLGFLDDAVNDVPAVTDKHRILLMGDSFVEGLGYPYPDTFAGRLRARLNGDLYEVQNAGMISYAPKLYYLKTKYLLEHEKVAFHEMVVFIDLSDPYDEVYYYRAFEPSGDSPQYIKPAEPYSLKDRLRGYLSDHSLFFHVFFPVRKRVDPRNVAPYMYDRGDWTLYDDYYEAYGKEGLALCGQYMTDLVELLREHDIALSLVIYPYPKQVEEHDRDSKQETFWKQFAADHDVPLLDLFPVFLDLSDPATYFIPNDVHWSAKGHQLVADQLVNWLHWDTR